MKARLVPETTLPDFPDRFGPVNRELWEFMFEELDVTRPWIAQTDATYLRRAALALGRSIEDVCGMMQSLSVLGWQLPEAMPEDVFNWPELSRGKLRYLLSRHLTGNSPWIKGPILQSMLRDRARRFGLNEQELLAAAKKLAAFGVHVAEDKQKSSRIVPTRARRLLGWLGDLLDTRRVHAFCILGIWTKHGGTVEEILDLEEPLMDAGLEIVGALQTIAGRLSSWSPWGRLTEPETIYRGAWTEWHEARSTPLQAAALLVTESVLCETNIGELARGLAKFGVLSEPIAEVAVTIESAELDELDEELVRNVAWDIYERGPKIDVVKFWFDHARFMLWEIPESLLRERIERLAPLFEASWREAARGATRSSN
jgi:hypothetical protein